MSQTAASYRILVIKTGALGDVLRTTSVLPGLRARYGAGLEVVWVTAKGAVALLEGLVGSDGMIQSLLVDSDLDREALVSKSFDLVLSLDDEEPLCALATAAAGGDLGLIVGAYLGADGQRAYTPAAGPWFDMGLLSVHGKAEADRMKVANERSHPAIYAGMLGIEMGEPLLELGQAKLAAAKARLGEHGGLRIGLNTGAGGRWRSKALPEQRVVELARELDRDFVDAKSGARPQLVLLGGPEEAERNARLAAGIGALDGVCLVDVGCENGLQDFASLIGQLDLLVTSDSMALHMATACKVPIVAFFAPTSAAEIELYGRGAKVLSTSPDFCSYARDADTSSLTVERLMAAALGAMGR